MSKLHTLGAVGLLLLAAWSGAAEPSPVLKSLRQAVLKAGDGPTAGAAYQALFMRAGRAGLRDLAEDPDPGIALQAAWELHKKPAKRTKPDPRRVDDFYDPDELARFVGILEKRLRVKAPAWWADSFRDVDLHRGSHCSVGGETHLKERKATTATVGLVAGPLFVRADCEDFGWAYELDAYELQGGRRAWRAPVWATGSIGGTGLHFHRVELKEKDGSLYVFGREGDLYLEVFETATGRAWVRFCTSYWDNYAEAWGEW